ncbi:MAG: double-strand break repair helicase AddA [Alphaproteobacteria bacterium]|nr:double-strand break repair helicase AddA [Alphaproteobacteria bacterium]
MTAGEQIIRQSQAEDSPSLRQARASHPMESHWVGASAGTGKTKVLIDRLLRLMLPRPGMDAASATLPGRILCLTFTRTAAAEMSARIYESLSHWSVMDDAGLDDALSSLCGHAPDDVMRRQARQLFARVLDTPGGLKIMTIHSFCQSVLKRFPLEAGLAPHFDLIDEQSAMEYLTRCLHDITAEARIQPDGTLAAAFSRLALLLDSGAMSDLIAQMMGRRGKLAEIFDHHGGVEGMIAAVYAALGADPAVSEADIVAKACDISDAHEKNLWRVLEGLSAGSTRDLQKAELIRPWLEDQSRRAVLFDAYSGAFLKDGGDEVYSDAYLATKGGAQKAFPDIIDLMRREGVRLLEVNARIKAVRLAQLNAALLTVAAEMMARYAQYKKNTDKLDYEDLIINTCALLSDSRAVQWVLFKLDEAIDHILVDEAQDTSPQQWRVVQAICEEYFAGTGSKEDLPRTLFVVGDEKQSIFSFQGADPGAFERMRRHFGARVLDVQAEWEVHLQHSFRSSRTVLSAVDSAFAAEDVKRGVVADVARAVSHLVHRDGQAGRVELWPLTEPAETAEKEAWQLPTEVSFGDDAAATLCRRMAATIRSWVDGGEMLPSKARSVRFGDILILVQSRGVFVDRLLRAMAEEDVPVAGVDRIVLTEHIAVMDMIAAAQFSLQPKDDLTLATILKSPLVGLDEDELFTLCHGRDGSLWRRVKDMRPDIAAHLQSWMKNAAVKTPYEFFAQILTLPCPADDVSGRRAFYARLGDDIRDAVDEFLNRCLSYEQTHTPSVQGFISWFLKGDSEIKRDQEQEKQDRVRIMTVHGSKGLQAPIVFMPDASKIGYDGTRAKPRMLWPPEISGVPLWAPRKDMHAPYYTDCLAADRAQQDDEYRRLLYVGMTRAEDRLYICGWKPKKKQVPEHSWYHIVRRALAGAAKEVETEDGALLRLEHPQTVPPKTETVAQGEDTAFRKPLPDWARQRPEDEAFPPVPLAPSRPGLDEPAAKGPLAAADEKRFHRGVIVHQILEILPQLPAEKWGNILQAWLARPALGLTGKQQKEFMAEILSVLRHPDFAPIFGAGSKAEVPLTGIAGRNVISGQMDRVLVTDKEVLIVDYKTNRPPPLTVEETPRVYLKQMAAYRTVMAEIYPARVVRCALLWTDSLDLMPLPDTLLDQNAP